MKKLMLILLLSIINHAIRAQVYCNWSGQCNDPCELIANGSFTDLDAAILGDGDLKPMSHCRVQCWNASNGSPHLPEAFGTPGCGPLNPNACYLDEVFMWFDGTAGTAGSGEGIYQDQQIINNHTYFCTYRIKYDNTDAAAPQMDNFWVQFINYDASFYMSNTTSGSAIPTPLSSQTVDHQIGLSNPTYSQKCAVQTANANYSAVWFYPQQNVTSGYCGVHLTDIHLYDVSSGVPVTTCDGTPVSIGPSCTIPGATYSWTPDPALIGGTLQNPVVTLYNSGISPITHTFHVEVTLPGCSTTLGADYSVIVTPNVFSSLFVTGPQNICTLLNGVYSTSMSSSSYTYNWSATGGAVSCPTCSTTTINFNTPGNQTVSLLIQDPVTGCEKKIIYPVNVYPYTETPNVTGSFYACNGILPYQITNYLNTNIYTINVTGGTLMSGPDALGIFTIDWTGTSGSIEIISTAPSPFSCSSNITYDVTSCCSDLIEWINVYPGHYDNTFDIWVDYLSPAPAVVSNKLITVNGNLDIDFSMVFNNCIFKMGDNAKINVVSGETLTLNGCTLTICNTPWDGIYINSSNASLIMNNCLAEHAKHAVASSNGGNFSINNSIFKDNSIGIDVKDFPLSLHPGTINGCQFFTSSPIITASSFTGINLSNLYNIVIGDQTLTSPINDFHDINYGVRAGKANYRVFNSSFSNIPGTVPFSVPDNAGILSLGEGNLSLPVNIQIEYNDFSNSENGILHAFTFTSVVKSNNMNNISRYGFYSYDPLNISSGYVKFVSNDLDQVRYGVSVIETSLPNSIGADIEVNSITNTDRGVLFMNLYKPFAFQNCITLNIPLTSVPNVGIFNQFCNAPDIESNTVQGPNDGSPTAGIRSDISQSSLFKNNYIKGCHYSMTTTGDCPNSQLRCNNMHQYIGAGFFMNQGNVGPQGTSGQSFYNKWYTPTNNKIVDAFIDGSFSRFYVRFTGVYNVTPAQTLNSTPSIPGTFPVPVTSGLYTLPDQCISDYPNLPCGVHPISGGGAPPDTGKNNRILKLNEWNVSPGIPKTSYEDYIQKDALFKMYLENSLDFSGISIPSFLTSLEPLQMKELNQASVILHSFPHFDWPRMDTTGVFSGDSVIIPVESIPIDSVLSYTNDLAGYQAQVNQLIRITYLRHKPYFFTLSEVDQLEYIANLCPIIYGGAIYEARAILEPITHTIYLNDCEIPGIFESGDKILHSQINQFIASVYPNPMESEAINVDLNISIYPSARIFFYDMLGRLVHTTALFNKENSIQLNDLRTGAYVCIIRDEQDNIIYQQKIIKL